jgi:glutamyl-tRNA synthetase
VGRLAYAAKLLPEYEPISPQELISLFSWEKLPQNDIVIGLSQH